MSRCTLVLIVLLGLFTGPVLALSNAQPKQGDLMLVIAPPWTDLAGLVIGAHGQPVGPVSAPIAIFAMSTSSDFIDDIRDAGALAVLDGRTIAHICGVKI